MVETEKSKQDGVLSLRIVHFLNGLSQTELKIRREATTRI